MRPLNPIVVTSTTPSAWVPLDIYTNNGQLKLDLTTGGSTCQVDYTDDNVFNVASPVVGGQLVASSSSNSVTNFTGPLPFAIRLNATVFVANATLKVIQQGIGGV